MPHVSIEASVAIGFSGVLRAFRVQFSRSVWTRRTRKTGLSDLRLIAFRLILGLSESLALVAGSERWGQKQFVVAEVVSLEVERQFSSSAFGAIGSVDQVHLS